MVQQNIKIPRFLTQPEVEYIRTKQEMVEILRKNGLTGDELDALSDKMAAKIKQMTIIYDSVTGYLREYYYMPTLERAWQQYQEADRNFSYAHIDFGNLEGLNMYLRSNQAANIHMKEIAVIIKQTLLEYQLEEIQFFRYYGDQFAVLLPGSFSDVLVKALLEAANRTKRYAQNNSLDQIYHPRVKKNIGIGIYFGVSQMNKCDNVAQMLAEAQQQALIQKEQAQSAIS